jgi:hypothetical protein
MLSKMFIIIIIVGKSSSWAIAFLGRFCEFRLSGFQFFGFRSSNFFKEQDSRPSVQPPTWRTRSLYLCPLVTKWPNYTPGIGFPFRRLLRLAVLRWRYFNPPAHGNYTNVTQPKDMRESPPHCLTFVNTGVMMGNEIFTFIQRRPAAWWPWRIRLLP